MDSSSTQSRLRTLRVMLHVAGASGLVALLLVAWWFLIRPIDAKRHVSSQRMALLETTLDTADEIRDEYASLSERLSTDRDREAALQARIPDDPSEAEFLALASELAAETGLKIQDYRPAKPVEEPSCSSLEVELICEGNYASVCGFLDGISKLPRLSRIERLHIDATKSKPGYLIEISVLLYFAARSDDSAWFKKGSGTVAGTARRVLRTTVPDPFTTNVQHCETLHDLSERLRLVVASSHTKNHADDSSLEGGKPHA